MKLFDTIEDENLHRRAMADLRHAGPDDLLRQRARVVGLPEAQLHVRRRVGVRRLVGQGAQDSGARLTIPGSAERRYGGVAADELLMAIPPRDVAEVLEGLAVSYADKERREA